MCFSISRGTVLDFILSFHFSKCVSCFPLLQIWRLGDSELDCTGEEAAALVWHTPQDGPYDVITGIEPEKLTCHRIDVLTVQRDRDWHATALSAVALNSYYICVLHAWSVEVSVISPACSLWDIPTYLPFLYFFLFFYSRQCITMGTPNVHSNLAHILITSVDHGWRFSFRIYAKYIQMYLSTFELASGI